MSNEVHNPMHPYHDNDDAQQINRYLQPMKNYSESPDQDIANYTRKKSSKLPETLGNSVTLSDYNNVKHLYGSEQEHAILNAVKQKAINASQEYLLEPHNKSKEDAFNDSQYELRQQRGGYIAKYIRFENTKTLKPYGYDRPPVVGSNRYNIVEFTCTRNGKNNIPVPIVSKVNTPFNIFELLNDGHENNHFIFKIFEVLEPAQKNILNQYNDQEVNRELLNKVFYGVKSHIVQYKTLDYFKHLGTNAERWDDTARKQISSAKWNTFDIAHRDSVLNIVYRSAVNYIIPTKVKTEHNVKTVHRFALDFTKILKPMHIDLIIKIGQIEFVWTIHEFEKGKHQIYHAGYIANENRLYNMPGTLAEMTKRYEDQVDKYTSPFFSKTTVDLASFDKSDISLLNLHTYALRVKADRMNGEFNKKHDQFTETQYDTDVGYIYKYNHYTIVASGITYPIHTSTFSSTAERKTAETYTNIMFYTIIHWNNTPAFQIAKTDVATAVTPTIRDLQTDIISLRTYVKNVDINYGQLVKYKDALPEAAFDKMDFFIPAILFNKTSNVAPNQHQDIGVYYLEEFPREDIEFIKHVFNKEKMRILQEDFKLHIDFKDKIFPDNAMLEDLQKHGFERGKFVTKVGIFGHYLKRYHEGDKEVKTPGKTELEEWSDFWHDFFALRPQYSRMYSFEQEDSNKMNIYHARIEDKRNKAYYHRKALFKQQGNGNTRHSNNTMGQVPIFHGRSAPKPKTPNSKKPSRPFGFHNNQQSHFTNNNTPSARLAAAVTCPEFTPQANTTKLQEEVDTLKRTLNELTLRMSLL